MLVMRQRLWMKKVAAMRSTLFVTSLVCFIALLGVALAVFDHTSAAHQHSVNVKTISKK